MHLLPLAALALTINLPLGYFRSRARPLSWPWFIWVHASIPLVAGARILSGTGLAAIPLLIVLSVIGQLLGGRIRA